MIDLRSKYGDVYGGAESEKVVAAKTDSLTVAGVTERASIKDINVRDTLHYTITYANIVDGVAAYAPDMKPIKLTDIKPNQHVKVAYKGDASVLWEEYAMGTTTDTTNIVAVFVISENVATMFETWDKYGFEFQQVKPCTNNPKEWCELLTDQSGARPTDTSTQPTPVQISESVSITGTETTAAVIVRDVYANYLGELSMARNDPLLRVDWVGKDARLYFTPTMNNKMPLGPIAMDKLLCAQNVPKSITVTDLGGQKISVVTHWQDSADQTIMLKVDDNNMISDLVCPVP